MSILKGIRYLLDIGNDGRYWQRGAFRMKLAQGPIGSIVHHQIGNFLLDAKVKNTHNIWMHEMSNGTCFSAKGVHILIGQLSMEHLDRYLSAQVKMLTKVDFGKATFSQQTGEIITAKLLPHTIVAVRHLHIPLLGWICPHCSALPLFLIRTL